TTFIEIEGAWADALVEAAEAETDLHAKRELLAQVAKSASVDRERRRSAAAKLEELDAQAAAIDELSEDQGTTTTGEPQKSGMVSGTNSQSITPRAAKPPHRQAPTAPAPKKVQRAPSPRPTAEDTPTLVRDD